MAWEVRDRMGAEYDELWIVDVDYTGKREPRVIAIVTDGSDRLDRACRLAAAPDLLAACERVLRSIEWETTEDRLRGYEQCDLLRAAIDKAKGASA